MLQTDIGVEKLNESELKISVRTPVINEELKRVFSAKPENYQFMPAYKHGIWDGRLYFYKNQILPIGFAEKLQEFARQGKYTIRFNFNDKLDIDFYEFKKFISMLNLSLEPRDYQIQAAYEACSQRKINIQLPTGSGKSLVTYIITRFLLNENQKVLIVVPRKNLVEQLFGDFEDYGWKGIHDSVHKIYSGKERKFTKSVTITTWQSLLPYLKKGYQGSLAEFGGVLIDEAHGAKGKSVNDIVKQCYNAKWKIGCSGTFHDKNTADWFALIGALGPIRTYITYRGLQEKGWIAGISINNLILNHSKEIRKKNLIASYKNYQNEVEFINNLQERNDFIVKLANSFRKNTIILFTRIEHGKYLKQELEKGDRIVHYIDGKIDVTEREWIRQFLEENENIVLLASFGTFEMGVNVKNVHNIIFASNYKSKIKVLQSIGRGVRSLEGKKNIEIYDIVDDLSIDFNGKLYTNYSYDHFKKRKKIYEKNELTDIINDKKINLG